ncbi:MAG: hypothetical protein OXI86_06565 [Candidatus Poribacteria bacterium]|nr:hypothetical protein [Candidatus Poribacteria bacterium]
MDRSKGKGRWAARAWYKGEIFNQQIEDFPCSAEAFAVIRPIAGRLYFVMK